MVTADLGACEWFVYELRRSNLIDRGQLDQVVGEFLKRSPQDIDKIKTVRDRWAFYRDRRPDAYGELVEA